MIYFMQPITGGPVKIGCSQDVDARHRQLERHYGVPLAVLATMEGDEAKEKELHDRFAHLRLCGPGKRGRHIEQFRPAAELMAFIGRPLLVGANPDAVEAVLPAGFDPSRNDRTAKIDATVLGWAETVAKAKGLTVAEYLSETLRVPVAKDFGVYMEKMKKGEA